MVVEMHQAIAQRFCMAWCVTVRQSWTV